MRIAIVHSPAFVCGAAIVVFLLNIIFASGTRLGLRDLLAALSVALYGAYCMQNVARCREAHCNVTGPGFLPAAATAGHGLERAYAKRTGTILMRRDTP